MVCLLLASKKPLESNNYRGCYSIGFTRSVIEKNPTLVSGQRARVGLRLAAPNISRHRLHGVRPVTDWKRQGHVMENQKLIKLLIMDSESTIMDIHNLLWIAILYLWIKGMDTYNWIFVIMDFHDSSMNIYDWIMESSIQLLIYFLTNCIYP